MSNTKNQNNPIIDIRVLGVGGCGNNSITKMINNDFDGVKFIFANTDKQALDMIGSENNIYLGSEINEGIGAGANPEIGKSAAISSKEQIRNKIVGCKLLIITAGMGGGTGTGASPIIAKIAKEMGIITIGIVTTPFSFEGRKRDVNSQKGIQELKKHVDSLIVVSNNKLLENYSEISFEDSFAMADKILKNTVQILTDIILKPSYINLDFADVCSVIKNKENAYIWQGRATGKDKVEKAVMKAVNSNILENKLSDSITDAIVNIRGGNDVSLKDANFIITKIKEWTNDNVNIIFGIRKDENLKNEIQVSIIATSEKRDFKDFDFNEDELSDFLNDEPKNNNNKELKSKTINKDSTNQDDSFVVMEEDDDEIPFFLK